MKRVCNWMSDMWINLFLVFSRLFNPFRVEMDHRDPTGFTRGYSRSSPSGMGFGSLRVTSVKESLT